MAPKVLLVTAVSGLNLRAQDSIRSKRLLTLPSGTIAPVKKVKRKTETLQGRNGFWIQTLYNGQLGWVFSGFVLFGQTADEVRAERERMRQRNMNTTERGLVQATFGEVEEPLPFLTTEGATQKLGPYSFTALGYRNKPNEVHCLAAMSGVRVRSPELSGVELQARRLVTLNQKLPNTVVIFSDLGGCSCRIVRDYTLYFLKEQKLRKVELFGELKSEGFCGFEGDMPSVETRYDPESKTLIQSERWPKCQEADGPPAPGAEGPKRIGWQAAKYTVVSGLGTEEVLVAQTKELSSAQSQAWQQGNPLTAR